MFGRLKKRREQKEKEKRKLKEEKAKKAKEAKEAKEREKREKREELKKKKEEKKKEKMRKKEEKKKKKKKKDQGQEKDNNKGDEKKEKVEVKEKEGEKEKEEKTEKKKKRKKKKKKKPVDSRKKIDDPFSLYTIKETLGEGSYGKVYSAISKKNGREYAIKVVHVEDDITEVEKEIEILAACMSPFIVRYYDSFLHPGPNDLWIVMEHCAGGSACDIVNILQQVLTEVQIATVVKGTLKGLKYLHKIKKIHRDVKAGNILIDEKGGIKLTDFGVSAQLTNSVSKRQTVIGTPYWMAPEVIQESQYDARADIWSLGVTILEMAEGQPPLADVHPMRAIFMIPSKEPPKLAEPEKYSPEMLDFVDKCLQKDQTKRPYAKKMLAHPWLKKASTGKCLIPLIERCYAKFEEYGGRSEYYKAMDELDKEDEGETDTSSSFTDEEFSDSGSDSDDDSDTDGTIKISDRVRAIYGESDDSSDDSSEDDDDDMIVDRTPLRLPSPGGASASVGGKKKRKVVVSSDTDSDLSSSSSEEDDDMILPKKKRRHSTKKPGPPALPARLKEVPVGRRSVPPVIQKNKKQERNEKREVARLCRLFDDFDLDELEVMMEGIDEELDEKIIELKENNEKKREALEYLLKGK